MRRRRRAIRAAALPAALLLCLSSCGRMRDFAAISSGNGLHERGRYQDALLAYLDVREASFAATVDYDMANVYARLGEYDAAAELYERARRGGGLELRADAYFNDGVALYEKGRFEEAWRAFRSALQIYLADPDSFGADFGDDARRNLELAWRSWKKRALVPPQTAAPSARNEAGSSEEELRLLRRLETGRWKPGVEGSPDDLRGDY
jgi:tetratricopeptide (TPR) repeat protein